MKKQIILVTSAALLMTAALYAQDSGSAPPPGHGWGGARTAFGPGPFGFGHRAKIVTGAPYSADVNSQSVQTLTDGNTITRSATGHAARDSQGRMYSQETITGGPFAQNGPVTITSISDPVAGYAYQLNSSTKVAVRRVFKVPSTDAAQNNHQGRSGGPFGSQDSSDVATNDLGTQNIGGVNAQGKSVTHTVPAGALGNAQPIVSTSETWYSPDLQIPVLAKRNDPRMGQSTYALTNIQRAEPSAALFQVPSDYTVKDAADMRGPHGGAVHAQPFAGSAQ